MTIIIRRILTYKLEENGKNAKTPSLLQNLLIEMSQCTTLPQYDRILAKYGATPLSANELMGDTVSDSAETKHFYTENVSPVEFVVSTVNSVSVNKNEKNRKTEN